VAAAAALAPLPPPAATGRGEAIVWPAPLWGLRA